MSDFTANMPNTQEPAPTAALTFKQRLSQIWDEEMARTFLHSPRTKTEWLLTVERIGWRVGLEFGACEEQAFWQGIEAWANRRLRSAKVEECGD